MNESESTSRNKEQARKDRALFSRVQGALVQGRARRIWCAALCVGAVILSGEVLTRFSLSPVPKSLAGVTDAPGYSQFLDRDGHPLSYTYQNRWNSFERLPLESVPRTLVEAFLAAEDHRFFEHRGVDARAIARAFWTNLRVRRMVTGGSTITEQVAKLLTPRPRTVWSRWLEMREALELEKRFSKGEILEFYLNQVPYARMRRGVVSEARTLFGRELDTLSQREAIALAVLVRAPSRLDPLRSLGESEGVTIRINRVAALLRDRGRITEEEFSSIVRQRIHPEPPPLEVDASAFLRFVAQEAPSGQVRTTLNAPLQNQVQKMLDARIRQLKGRGVGHGAALVVDNQTHEIVAWVNAQSNGAIDGVLTPRQPGSTLKPFLYALAFEQGWSPATVLHDEPLARRVGNGIKRFRNSSGEYSGPLRIRESLGNSLNIPAVETVSFVGEERFLQTLHALGFTSLKKESEFYGEGLALGNGEVSLYELTRAYVGLANGGETVSLRALAPSQPRERSEDEEVSLGKRVFSKEATSLIANILSDPYARDREFENAPAFDLPMQVAVKTGTSTDYRDAWTIGFSSRYTVGVWMGNLDRSAMHEVTGSSGPAMVVKSIFHELGEAPPLRLARELHSREICASSGLVAGPNCPHLSELFLKGTEPHEECRAHHQVGDGHEGAALVRVKSPLSLFSPSGLLRLELPTEGLKLARDPRIPDELEAFRFLLPSGVSPSATEWILDDVAVGRTGGGVRGYLWKLTPGTHHLRAKVWLTPDSTPIETEGVQFSVR